MRLKGALSTRRVPLRALISTSVIYTAHSMRISPWTLPCGGVIPRYLRPPALRWRLLPQQPTWCGPGYCQRRDHFHPTSHCYLPLWGSSTPLGLTSQAPCSCNREGGQVWRYRQAHSPPLTGTSRTVSFPGHPYLAAAGGWPRPLHQAPLKVSASPIATPGGDRWSRRQRPPAGPVKASLSVP